MIFSSTKEVISSDLHKEINEMINSDSLYVFLPNTCPHIDGVVGRVISFDSEQFGWSIIKIFYLPYDLDKEYLKIVFKNGKLSGLEILEKDK